MTQRLLHIAAVAGAAALLAGCGADDEPKGKGIPAESVAELVKRLDEVQRRFDQGVDNDNVGACNDIESDSIPGIETAVAGLPSDVDPDIRETLENGIQRLRELAQEGCSGVEPAETETTPEETVPQETVTETVPEETVPEETETQPQETVPQDPQGRGPDGQGPPGQGGGAVPPEDGNGD